MSAPVSPTFCVLPWMHVFADEQGAMYPCCRSVGEAPPNATPAGDVYRVHEDGGLEAAWNSAYMRGVRADMLAGRRPQPCARCYMYEDLGMHSHRQDQNDRYADRLVSLAGATAADGSAPLTLTSLDLRLGNTCNLRCRMCSPQSSKALVGEFAAAYGTTPAHPAFARFARVDWFEDPGVWDLIARHGEPLDGLLASLDGIVTHLFEREADESRAEFVRWSRLQDRTRHQDVLAVLPELAPLYAEEGAPA